MRCRFCSHSLEHVFVDLINTPLSNSLLNLEQLGEREDYFPLKVFFCDKCWLVQIDEHKNSEEIFSKTYPYFSSFSTTWLKHSEDYVHMIAERLGLTSNSSVIEIASNDGYLLQFFRQKGIPCLGIEPSESTVVAARQRGLETITEFFSEAFARDLARKRPKANLILGNNVLAHVPNINDFVAGLKVILEEHGTVTMEFPHVLNLIEFNQFDTIYHEHFSYFSLITTVAIFSAHDLSVYDVEELPTHGGSLRVYIKHTENKGIGISESVAALTDKEENAGLRNIEFYESFQAKANRVKYDFLSFLLQEKREGRKIAAYGAAAKGNTLLNYCGIKADLIEFVVDASPHKQNKFMPGSHIPIVAEAKLKECQPDLVVVLPWNLKEEILEQLHYVRQWGGRFVMAIPELTIV